MMDITENCDSLNFLMYLGVACVIYSTDICIQDLCSYG